MELFPHAKINLSLYITGRREDGYHLLDTIYWPVALFDSLKIEPGEPLSLEAEQSISGPDNLLLKAWQLLHRRYGIPPLRMVLEKRIPWEAGLGGGSGDAAALLLACNRIFRLGIRGEDLEKLGETLGADVPAALREEAVRGRGIGTDLEAFESSLKLPLLILKPSEGFSTAAMYKAWDEGQGGSFSPEEVEERQRALMAALGGDSIRGILPYLHNDFESVLKEKARRIFDQARDLLGESGAAAAMLCGSGSALFGLYETQEKRKTGMEELEKRLPEGWILRTPQLEFPKI
ncbi:MAG: 4-(cytidine 5'-diphospho)-2-C-methyl-D-erythritol kinase [Lachnospiraceae bacterium]|nr:4-(cytidine 5'-diphospho)-2-C-methyl-D-erythritol kinase [Lachnospiraceae bacterium]